MILQRFDHLFAVFARLAGFVLWRLAIYFIVIALTILAHPSSIYTFIMNLLVLIVSNLRCPSCVVHVQDVPFHLPGIRSGDEVSLINQTIRVVFDSKLFVHQLIINASVECAFDIKHVVVFDDYNPQIDECNLPRGSYDETSSQPRPKHIDNCDACQKEWGQNGTSLLLLARSTTAATSTNDNPTVTDLDDPSKNDSSASYTASLSIERMSCGSCIGKVTSRLEELLFVPKVNINLLTNGSSVQFRRKNNLDSILDKVSEIGYEATPIDLVEPRPKSSLTYTASLSIDGMSCGSCVGKITAGLEGLLFISKVNIDLLTNSGSVEFVGKRKLYPAFEFQGHHRSRSPACRLLTNRPCPKTLRSTALSLLFNPSTRHLFQAIILQGCGRGARMSW